MFMLRDKLHPIPGLTDYFRTYDEAVEARSKREMHTADSPDPIPGEEYLEIFEVERESRPCVYCGHEVQSDGPEINYCRNCFYTGRDHEGRRAPLINALRSLDCVESADIWHTGGGCFLLAITLTDGRLITTTAGYADEETGLPTGDAVLPDPGDPWWLVISASVKAFEEFREEEMGEDLALYDDDELVARVKELGTTPSMI